MAALGIRTSRIVALSLVVGVFFTSQTVFMTLAAGRPISIERDVVQELLFWIVWAFLTPVVLAAVHRWPLDARPLYRSLLAHAAVSTLLAPAQTIIAFGLRPLVLWMGGLTAAHDAWPLLTGSRTALVWGVFMGVFFYWVIVGVYTALRFRGLYAAERVSAADLASRSATLEAELVRAKLDSLRSQLRPHFLFNTLNAISVLAVEDAQKTRQMLIRLGSLLRRSLEEEQHEVPLQQELAFLGEYLDIQRVRFGDRLRVFFTIDPSVSEVRVPVFLLQPLLENAIEHGAPEHGATCITVSAGRAHSVLHLTVEDNGPGPGDSRAMQEGVGLRNTRARLHHLYGDRASLTLGARDSTPGVAGTRVEIRLPFAPTSG